MGVKDLIEIMRSEALTRLKEERRRRRESLKFRLHIPISKTRSKGVERGRKLV